MDPFCLLCRGRYWATVQQSPVRLQLTAHHLLGKHFLHNASMARSVPAPWIYCPSPVLAGAISAFAASLLPPCWAAISRVPLGAQPDPCGSEPRSHSQGKGHNALQCSRHQGCKASVPPPASTLMGVGWGTQTPYNHDPTAECAGTFCPVRALFPWVKWQW